MNKKQREQGGVKNASVDGIHPERLANIRAYNRSERREQEDARENIRAANEASTNNPREGEVVVSETIIKTGSRI